MNEKQKKEIVDSIIRIIGKEKDRPAYERIADNFEASEIIEAINITKKKDEAGELYKKEPRRYFMGIMKIKGFQKGIRLFDPVFEKPELNSVPENPESGDND